MDRELSPLTRDYTLLTTDTLQNAVYIRLTTPLGSWWADGRVGSLLHTLTREKELERVVLLAKQYAEEALAPLLLDKRAKSIEVSVERLFNHTLQLIIQVTDNRNKTTLFKHPVKLL